MGRLNELSMPRRGRRRGPSKHQLRLRAAADPAAQQAAAEEERRHDLAVARQMERDFGPKQQRFGPTGPGGPGGGGAGPASGGGGETKKSGGGFSSMMKSMGKKLGLAYQEIPAEVYESEDLDLKVWSVLIDDKCLRKLAAVNEKKCREGVAVKAAPGSELDRVAQKGGAGGLGSLMLGVSKAQMMGERLTWDGFKTLRIPGAGKVTDGGLVPLSAQCTALKALDISRCYGVSDVGVRAVARNCGRLEELQMAGCRRVANAGLVTVGQCCKRLRVLNLSRCDRIEPWLFHKLGEGCPLLEVLNLSRHPKLTDDTLKVFAHHCRNLREVDLAHCKQISDIGPS